MKLTLAAVLTDIGTHYPRVTGVVQPIEGMTLDLETGSMLFVPLPREETHRWAQYLFQRLSVTLQTADHQDPDL